MKVINSAMIQRTSLGRREDVKTAVKEALDDKRMEDIAKQLTDLATQMTDGFARVNARQDTANGKLTAHDSKFLLIEQKNRDVKIQERIMWLALTTLVSVVTYFVTKM